MVCCIAAVAVLAVLTRFVVTPLSWIRGTTQDSCTLPTAQYTAQHAEKSGALQ